MGTYLATGIVYKVRIQKRDMDSRQFTIENILKSLQKELNIEMYVFGEDEDTIFLEIKPEMLEGNFSEFLEEQFKLYGETEDTKKVIVKVRDAKTGEEIIELAKRGSLSFQMTTYINEDIRVLRENGFSDKLRVNYHMIAFFMNGKITMECYGDIFRYFEKSIRLQEEKYPIVGCLKIMIAG